MHLFELFLGVGVIKLDHVGGDLTDRGEIFQRVEHHLLILTI